MASGYTPLPQVVDADEVRGVITRVVAMLQDCGLASGGRYTLGNVAAYLLQWALQDLSTEEQNQALDHFHEYVLDLLGEPRRRLDG